MIGQITWRTEFVFVNVKLNVWKPLHAQSSERYLERYVRHRFGQIIRLQAVPVVEMFPHEHRHLQRNCGGTAALEDRRTFNNPI